MDEPDRGYRGERVEFYDAQTADADRGDVAFYRDRALNADGPALELACGTGRVYLELLRAGVDADGFDGSPIEDGDEKQVWTLRKGEG